MAYFKRLVGEKCYLSPISMDMAEDFTKWLNDMEVIIHLDTNLNLSLEGERDFITNAVKTNQIIMGIVDNKTDKLLGNCALVNLNTVNRSAELGIFIGEKEYWNRGYGTDALRLLLDYGFNILNLNNIMLRVKEFNIRGYKCYQKLGFKEIGRRRKCEIIGGCHYDMIMMDMLAEEFQGGFINKTMTLCDEI